MKIQRGTEIDWSQWHRVLEAKWAEGLSLRAIADLIPGATPGAVNGRLRRTKQPSRGSPIKGDPAAINAKRAATRAKSQSKPAAVVPPSPIDAEANRAARIAAGHAARKAKAAAAYVPPRISRAVECQWPLNAGRPWQFCCAEPRGDKPYCAEHSALAYVVIRDRREDAAEASAA